MENKNVLLIDLEGTLWMYKAQDLDIVKSRPAADKEPYRASGVGFDRYFDRYYNHSMFDMLKNVKERYGFKNTIISLANGTETYIELLEFFGQNLDSVMHSEKTDRGMFGDYEKKVGTKDVSRCVLIGDRLSDLYPDADEKGITFLNILFNPSEKDRIAAKKSICICQTVQDVQNAIDKFMEQQNLLEQNRMKILLNSMERNN